MRLPPLNSFLVGFVAALILAASCFVYRTFDFIGGTGADSPNGKYGIMITGPMKPRQGGVYTITLSDKRTATTLRLITMQVAASESTQNPREGGALVNWDATSSHADITIGKSPLLRVYVPTPTLP